MIQMVRYIVRIEYVIKIERAVLHTDSFHKL